MKDTENNASISTISPALVSALQRVLRPLIKLMLTKGITYPYLIDIIKKIFVEVADKEFRADGQSSTDSYLSVLTGVHRKDIKRLRSSVTMNPETMPQVISLGARLVSIWTSDALYLDENGRPKPLARFARNGGELSFERLVARVSSDIRSRVVLDEWLRLGVVYFDDLKQVCLNIEAFVPAEGFDEKAYYMGHNLHDHTAAIACNLIGEGQPFLERSVHYDELSKNSIKVLAGQSELLGMQSLQAVNKKAMVLEKKDISDSGPRFRMTLGIYFYSEQVESQGSVVDTHTSADDTTVKEDSRKSV